jgi:hypothetical protein
MKKWGWNIRYRLDIFHLQATRAATFWAARLGMLFDQFGTPWMVNREQSGRRSLRLLASPAREVGGRQTAGNRLLAYHADLT